MKVSEAQTPAQRVGIAKALFKQCRLAHPGQAELETACEELRISAMHAPGEDCGGVLVRSPIGTGKTIGAEMYRDKINAQLQATAEFVPVVLATLDASGTARSIPSAILRALRVARHDVGKEETLWLRARSALKEKKVQLLMLDEMDRAARRPSLSGAIAGSLRDLADERLVPVVFLSTKKSDALFSVAQDLEERLDAPVILHPLDWLDNDDKQLLMELCRGFDEHIKEAGILKRLAGLGEEGTAELLSEASSGILRRLKMIIGTAMMNVVRRGGDVITRDDLATAVQEYAIAKRFIKENPFRKGDR